MKNLSTNHYATFKRDERINLTLSAIARNDSQEIALLQTSCPKKCYWGADFAYQNRLQGLLIINLKFNQLLAYYQHKLQLTQSCALTYSFLSDFNINPMPESHKAVNTEQSIEQLMMTASDYQAALKTVCTGFIQFCNQIKIDFNHILTLDKFNDTKASDLSKYTILAIESDTELLNQVKAMFQEIWGIYTHF